MSEKKNSNKIHKRILITVVIILLLSIAYSAGIGYYANRFQANTKFGSIDISNLTLPKAQEKVEQDFNKKQVKLEENGKELGTITMADLDGKVNTEEILKKVYNSQDPNTWIVGFFTSHKYGNVLMDNVEIEDKKVDEALSKIGLNNEDRTSPVSAQIEYADGTGYYVEDEKGGDQLDIEAVKKELLNSIQTGRKELEINTLYLQPKVKAKDEIVADTMAAIDKASDTKITLDISGDEVTIPKEDILAWMAFDDNNRIVFDQDKITSYIDDLNKKYATYDKVRQFHSTLRGLVDVQPGTLGWSIDTEAESAKIATELASGTDVNREVSVVGSGYNANGDDIGNSYIEVDLQNQMMFIYKNGEEVLQTPIVSGFGGSTETVPGAYSLWNKEENATLVGRNQQTGNDYRQPVSYWLPFDDTGQGIHDANWQSNFGGNVYMYAGSQGCINTPPGTMPEVFALAEVGMPVIVF